MFIPSSSELCPSKILSSVFEKRSFTSDVTSTADSFKHWDTCMDNKVCKIVAIVGIVLALLFVLWIISFIINCICCGADCLRAMCCCCCNSSRPRYRDVKETNDPYNNPNMYPAPQQNYQYQPPSTMAPSYSGYKTESYGYVRDSEDDGVPKTNSNTEYYSGNTAANPYSPVNHNNSNNYRGQNTYF